MRSQSVLLPDWNESFLGLGETEYFVAENRGTVKMPENKRLILIAGNKVMDEIPSGVVSKRVAHEQGCSVVAFSNQGG